MRLKRVLSKRRLLLALFGALLLLIGAETLSFHPEPVYQGRKLSAWVMFYAPTAKAPTGSPTPRQAAEAIRRIGTNSFPYLLRWIQYEVPWWKGALTPMVNKLQLRASSWNCDLLRADAAKQSFQVFGPTAGTLIPQLAEMMRDPRSGEAGRRALRALAYIGDDSLPVLLSALQNPGSPNRYLIAAEIRQMQKSDEDATLAVPVLLNCLTDTDTGVSAQVGATLNQIARDQPAGLIAILTNIVHTADTPARVAAVDFLGGMGDRATPALPTLLHALRDDNKSVRTAATAAVTRVSQ